MLLSCMLSGLWLQWEQFLNSFLWIQTLVWQYFKGLTNYSYPVRFENSPRNNSMNTSCLMKPMKVYVEPNFLHLVKTTTKKNTLWIHWTETRALGKGKNVPTEKWWETPSDAKLKKKGTPKCILSGYRVRYSVQITKTLGKGVKDLWGRKDRG